MNSAIERLLSLRVSDVMHAPVVRISTDQTMASAAAILLEHEISGAPVVDERDACVGMLSAVDFLRKETGHPREGTPPSSGAAPGILGASAVAPHMSKNVQSIAPQATLLEAARAMCSAHVHRLPVLDASGLPVGIVSSLDIAAALVQAIEE